MNDHLITQPVTPENIGAVVPEFVDAKGLKAVHGISRSHGYHLADAGLVKTVCLRKPGATRGKRLWQCQSIRDYLQANIDRRVK